MGVSQGHRLHVRGPSGGRDADPVDGNQLCDLGQATQNMLFYIGLAAMAQLQQGADI
jgi:hypothetical protein